MLLDRNGIKRWLHVLVQEDVTIAKSGPFAGAIAFTQLPQFPYRSPASAVATYSVGLSLCISAVGSGYSVDSLVLGGTDADIDSRIHDCRRTTPVRIGHRLSSGYGA